MTNLKRLFALFALAVMLGTLAVFMTPVHSMAQTQPTATPDPNKNACHEQYERRFYDNGVQHDKYPEWSCWRGVWVSTDSIASLAAAEAAPAPIVSVPGCDGYTEGSVYPNGQYRAVCQGQQWVAFEGGCYESGYLFPVGSAHPYVPYNLCEKGWRFVGYHSDGSWIEPTTSNAHLPERVPAPAPTPLPVEPYKIQETALGWMRTGGMSAPNFVPRIVNGKSLSLNDAIYAFEHGPRQEVAGTRRTIQVDDCTMEAWKTTDNLGVEGVANNAEEAGCSVNGNEVVKIYNAVYFYGSVEAKQAKDAATEARLTSWWEELGGPGCRLESIPPFGNYAGYNKWNGNCKFDHKADKPSNNVIGSGFLGFDGLQFGPVLFFILLGGVVVVIVVCVVVYWSWPGQYKATSGDLVGVGPGRTNLTQKAEGRGTRWQYRGVPEGRWKPNFYTIAMGWNTPGHDVGPIWSTTIKAAWIGALIVIFAIAGIAIFMSS